MQLEIISHSAKNPNDNPPLLFIHGAFCGAWVWDEHFLPFFAANGYTAHALSLRGHGLSKSDKLTHSLSLSDYVQDLDSVVADLAVKPVLIGHSLGGVVIQKWLKDHAAPGVVLMGSGPPHGMLPCSAGMMLRNPFLVAQLVLAQMLGPSSVSPKLARGALFSDEMPADTVHRYFCQTSGESLLVGFELAWPDFPDERWDQGMPMLVLGAANDFLISPTMVQATAQVYKTQAEIFPNMAHAMMLEPNWQHVAERILQWLEQTAALRLH